jgi:hypothetical protein
VARREDIVNTIWDELDHLSDDGLMLYIWSWTNTKCGMAGIYKVARRKLVEGRFSEERLDAALAELEEEGLLRYVNGVLWNCARVKRLSAISQNIAKSIAKDLGEIDPANPIVAEFVSRYGGHPELKGLQTLCQGSQDPPENVGVEPNLKGSRKGLETLPGRGRGTGSGSSVVNEEFNDWLEHYVATTGYTGTTGSKSARESFAARRREGLTLEELKLATVGCHSDPFNREHHHDVPDTILRVSKVTRYVKMAIAAKQPSEFAKYDKQIGKVAAA